jgi:hypothetical protein
MYVLLHGWCLENVKDVPNTHIKRILRHHHVDSTQNVQAKRHLSQFANANDDGQY